MIGDYQLIQGDCREVLIHLPPESVDLVLTDPPYGVRYRDRTGRTVANDDRLEPVLDAFTHVYRVLKNNTFCISFYGWNRVDEFFGAWRAAGFYPVGHIVWQKDYGSSRGFLEARHEQAYVLAKGRPAQPARPIADVQCWDYSGNRVHPTQKSPKILVPLIESFSQPGGLVMDPFAGSGSCGIAALSTGRRFLGIELEAPYCHHMRQSLPTHIRRAQPHSSFDNALAGFLSSMQREGVALPEDFDERVRRTWLSGRSL